MCVANGGWRAASGEWWERRRSNITHPPATNHSCGVFFPVSTDAANTVNLAAFVVLFVYLMASTVVILGRPIFHNWMAEPRAWPDSGLWWIRTRRCDPNTPLGCAWGKVDPNTLLRYARWARWIRTRRWDMRVGQGGSAAAARMIHATAHFSASVSCGSHRTHHMPSAERCSVTRQPPHTPHALC